MIILSIITIVFYLTATAVQMLTLAGKLSRTRILFLVLGFFAVILHATLLHWWIDIGMGQNLTFFNMFSMVVWLVSTLILLAALRMPIENLAILIFPLAAISIIAVLAFPAYYVIDTAANPKQLVHILLSILTVSVLWVAGLQSILLAIQERQLRSKRVAGIVQKLPPLETMESLLFQMIWLGFILLSIVIVTGFYFYYQVVSRHLLIKSLLVIIAWGIFAVLLIGRHLCGWRGRKAIYYTLFGVVLLVFAYFGSKLVLEFIL